MNKEQFAKLIKKNRAEIIKPYDLIFQEFIKLEIDKMSTDSIKNNVSSLIDDLRKNSWSSFKPMEKEFTVKTLNELVTSNNQIKNLKGIDAATSFIETYPEYIYTLSLSNTNSRRSRAGKEFEAILELLLMACNVSMNSQGNIGKKEFINKGLGKMVDIITPTTTQFNMDKYNTVLISAKTTLRERWQEVSEEHNRTSANSMLLATLDNNITKDVIESLNEAGIRLVVPLQMKQNTYEEYGSVISYEQMFKEIIKGDSYWNDVQFKQEQKEEIVTSFKKQQQKHKNHSYIYNYYENQIEKFKNL